jgi:hypothetical protein
MMNTMEHEFTLQIKQILHSMFGAAADDLYERSLILQYLNVKTRSATRGAKARSSFANIYAIYVLVEDYVNKRYDTRTDYAEYEGARYVDLFRRQRELPFGSKLQNHALNSRMNEEFRKYFPQTESIPILRDLQSGRYWINQNLLKLTIGDNNFDLARAILQIIDRYVEMKRSAFENFIQTGESLKSIVAEDDSAIEGFIFGLLAPHVDARIFEIVSYSILKFYYHDQTVYFGFELDSLREENLHLYKTGRTNANDGGIDFVMRPLGRFFQVTETLNVNKYFLDIDKIERYPISFVVKSPLSIDAIQQRLRKSAETQYAVNAIVEKYMNCIEEIINLEVLQQRFQVAIANGYLHDILEEIILQSRVEFNYQEEIIE